jgi:cytochrome P450
MASERAVVEMDQHSPEYAKDPWGMLRRSREESGSPVVWSNQHGGFWHVLGYEELKTASRDDATFSSSHDLPNGSTPFQGINCPSFTEKFLPIEVDPPEFAKWRLPINRWFSPEHVASWRPKMIEYTTWCIDQHIEGGSIEFVENLGGAMPAILTLELFGLPIELWEEFSHAVHNQANQPGGSPKQLEAGSKYREITTDNVLAVAEQRRREPKDDFIGALTKMKVDGRLITDEELIQLSSTIIAGGLDTTTGWLSHALSHLDLHPDQRQMLIDDPSLIPSAGEELLRFYSPLQNLARTATRDVELGGQQIRAGERVLLCWASANMDEAEFEKPDEFQIDRSPNRHAAFGIGIHRCIGSHLARAEFQVMLSEVLKRMPDYSISEGARKSPSIGVVHGYAELPATFTPGVRSGSKSILDDLLR